MKHIIFIFILIISYSLSQSTSESPCDDNSTCTTDVSADLSTDDTLITTEEDDEDEDYDNSTVSSTELPGTVAVNTTLQPNVTTVAPTLPPTTPQPIFPSKDLEAVPCTCDLLGGACDIGCCCDVDCSTDDRKVFSHCLDYRPPFPADPNLCHRAHWWYKENTEYGGTQYHGGLLCLHTDNLPDRHWLDNPKIVTSIKQFDHLVSRTSAIPWPSLGTSPKPELIPGQLYKSGDFVWALENNKTIRPFAIPSNAITSNCEVLKNVLYLENWNTKCNYILTERCEPEVGSINSTDFFSDFHILANPYEPIWNQTDPWLAIKPHVCPLSSLYHKYPQNCSELTELKFPTTFSHLGMKCENSVVKARYVIQHNGTEGIASVNVFFWLDSLPISVVVHQSLEVLFEWSGSHATPEQRSGRPGYIQSWPVRAGVLNEAKSTISSLNLTRGHSESWLSIPSSGPRGFCEMTKRRTVLFNENILSQCVLSLSSSNFTRSGCANMTQNVLQLFLGHMPANQLVIAAFGDSHWGTLIDWVPVMFKDLPQEGKYSEILLFNNDNKTEKSVKTESDIGFCEGVSTNLNIQFLWASVGSHSSPQNKILGVLYHFSHTKSLEPPKPNETLNINLVLSISFTDISPPVQPRFAPLPKYEIRLPRDFFYPLFSTSNSNSINFSPILTIFPLIFLVK